MPFWTFAPWRVDYEWCHVMWCTVLSRSSLLWIPHMISVHGNWSDGTGWINTMKPMVLYERGEFASKTWFSTGDAWWHHPCVCEMIVRARSSYSLILDHSYLTVGECILLTSVWFLYFIFVIFYFFNSQAKQCQIVFRTSQSKVLGRLFPPTIWQTEQCSREYNRSR